MALGRGPTAIVEQQLTVHLGELENKFGSDVLTYVGPIVHSVDDRIKDAVEALRRRKPRLLFVLETNGGFAEVARRVSDALRHHYKMIDYLIPSHAMSAGTILAMSGDSIWMNYYSVLGPIDPQVPGPDGRLIPALGALIRYQELLDKANKGTAGAGDLEILLSFNQAELYSFDQARALSISLLEEWLAKYKFKNWKVTERRGLPVTRAMKKARAREIASNLNDVNRWNSHGIGISMQVLRRELKLKIDDFGKEKALDQCVRQYHKLLVDYKAVTQLASVVHTRERCDAVRWRIA
jgi:membrane-bound ClpP family serine protease